MEKEMASFSSFDMSLPLYSILAIQHSSTVTVLTGSTLALSTSFTTVVWIILLLEWDFKTRYPDPLLMFFTLKLAFPATVETSR